MQELIISKEETAPILAKGLKQLAQCLPTQITRNGYASLWIKNGEPDFKGIHKNKAIVKLVEELGKETVVKIVYAILFDFCSAFNFQRNMTIPQMTDCALMMVDECGSLRIEDYMAMFRMAKTGKLGELYGKLDIMDISRFMDAYHEMRGRDAEKQIQIAEQKRKEQKMLAAPKGEIVEVDLSKAIAELNRIRDENIEREIAERKNRRQQQREAYAKAHGIKLESIKQSITHKTEPDANDIAWWESFKKKKP